MRGVSAILVTYNPRRDLLAWALSSLVNQTLPESQIELIVIDNNSNPPLTSADLEAARGIEVRLLREPRQGNVFARCLAIKTARHEICAFIDDDNHLDPDYFETALSILAEHPRLGAIGGIARPVFETPVRPWKHRLLPYLGIRDYGQDVITSDKDEWGPWEPIGAGMVFRADVGRRFVELVESNQRAQKLGRRGTILLSAEDSLLARCAYRLGYLCSYQPGLKISHWMKPARLRSRVLAGTLEGHGRSYILLERLLGRTIDRPTNLSAAMELCLRYRHRVSMLGLRAGTIEWFWDIGYFRQLMEEG
jgi:glycosyltransferase involved in cell wall biosynthesis